MENKQQPIGFNLYADNGGRTIYYDRFSKQAYLISKKEETKYFFFSSRPVSAFVVGFIAYYFSKSWPITIFAAIVTYLTLLFFFRKMFLADLAIVPKFIPSKKDPLYKRLAEAFSAKKIVLIILLAYALAIGTIVNVQLTNYDYLTKIFNYVLAIGAFIFGSYYIYVLIYKRRK